MDIGVYCLNVGQASCAAIIDPLPDGEEDQFQASLIDAGVDGPLAGVGIFAAGEQGGKGDAGGASGVGAAVVGRLFCCRLATSTLVMRGCGGTIVEDV